MRTARLDTLEDIFNFWLRYEDDHDGFTPTIRQIAEAIDASTSTVQKYVDMLEIMGKLRRGPNRGQMRSVR